MLYKQLERNSQSQVQDLCKLSDMCLGSQLLTVWPQQIQLAEVTASALGFFKFIPTGPFSD